MKWFFIGLAALVLNVIINHHTFYRNFLYPIEKEIKKCRSDIVIEIDGKKLLVPRDSKIYKTDWIQEKDTDKICSIESIEDVNKIYWRNLKISSADDFYSKNQTWWDWRKYEISNGKNKEIIVPDLEKIELPEQNKELYIFDAGREFTKDKKPIIFECAALEKNLSLNIAPGSVENKNSQWFERYGSEHQYCFTSYLHQSGLVYSYSFIRKAHKAPYFPKDYPQIDAQMRRQLDLFFKAAAEKQKNISNVISDIRINRFVGSSDDQRYKKTKSYKCKGNVTLAIGNSYVRIPRAGPGHPPSLSLTFKDNGRYDDGAALPENDCGIEYIDNISKASQAFPPFGFYSSEKHIDRFSPEVIEQAKKQGGVIQLLENHLTWIQPKKGADIYLLPLDKAPTADNNPVVYMHFPRSQDWTTSYMHPAGFMVLYSSVQGEIEKPDDVFKYDSDMRKKIQKFIDDAKLIPISK